MNKDIKQQNPNEVRYKDTLITRLFPSGMYEFYCHKQERFLKYDDLDEAKKYIQLHHYN